MDDYRLIGRLALTDNVLGGSTPSFSSPTSQICGYGQFLDPDFLRWVREMGLSFEPHRKVWENAFIAQVASHAGVLHAGLSAMGFGCGQEPLPSLFANYGMNVLASDQPQQGTAAIWAETGEHAESVQSLFHSNIVTQEIFEERVRFRPIDMLDIPDDLAPVDLVWSACTIEHLGTPALGLEFILKSLELLRPGGVAVHTTEFDLIEREVSLDLGHCAIYQRKELLDFLDSLDPALFETSINFWVPMEYPADNLVSRPPYSPEEPHLKLILGPTITTSVGLVIKRVR